jgi:hypothetical protein
MNTPDSTALDRAETLRGILARQLNQIAPGTARVRIVPVEPTARTPRWVTLDDVTGAPVEAERDAHRDALRLLRNVYPDADWSRALTYDATTGTLTPDAPPAVEPADDVEDDDTIVFAAVGAADLIEVEVVDQ